MGTDRKIILPKEGFTGLVIEGFMRCLISTILLHYLAINQIFSIPMLRLIGFISIIWALLPTIIFLKENSKNKEETPKN